MSYRINMKNRFNKLLTIAAFFSVAFIGCVEDDKDSPVINVDQTAFLQNTGTIIRANYERLNNSVNTMAVAIDTLSNNATETNLLNAQNALKQAYLDFQKVSPFEFGPAESANLKNTSNVFKTDSAAIEKNISTSNFNFDQFGIEDQIGFPALDYLLNNSSIGKLKSDKDRCTYIKAVTQLLQEKVNNVNADWNSYQTKYSNQMGTDVGSSTGMLVNALNQHFERYFRDNKIGVPLGIRSSGIMKLDFVEARFGEYSLALALENLAAMKTIYTGAEGYGLDDYLIASGAEDLNNTIINQLDIIEQKLAILTDPLSTQIRSNPNQVQEAYTEMQKLIVLWKVDMPSRMGVLITYQDNDGD